MVRNICKDAGVDEKKYTNHSIRATTLTIFAQHMIPIQHQKKISGHRSDSAVESYANRLSEKNTIAMHDELQAALGGNPQDRPGKRGYRGTADVIEAEETITLSQSSEGEVVQKATKRVKLTKASSDLQCDAATSGAGDQLLEPPNPPSPHYTEGQGLPLLDITDVESVLGPEIHTPAPQCNSASTTVPVPLQPLRDVTNVMTGAQQQSAPNIFHGCITL